MYAVNFLCLFATATTRPTGVVKAFHEMTPRRRDSRGPTAFVTRCDGLLFSRTMALKNGGKSDDDSNNGANESDGQKNLGDWRDFRAKLVMQEKRQEKSSTKDKNTVTSDSPKQWAYESGPVIEAGSIILSKPNPVFGYGLRQQYFHKSAILVLKHEENFFTRAILLNRPSNLILDNEWRVWFGGDVQGMRSDDTEIVCLHSLSSKAADEVSTLVMKDIKYTMFENAKKLVKAGEAVSSDFWLFAGYCGWRGGQLLEELARDSWIMISTDSGTVLNELTKRNNADIDPRKAGMDTWEFLMDLVGRDHASTERSSFDDLMLLEWARDRLDFKASGSEKASSFIGGRLSPVLEGPVDTSIDRAISDTKIQPGYLFRGSSSSQSPFLLADQDMHKCIVLVTSDDDQFTTGVYLNHPTSKVIDLPVTVQGLNHTLPVPFVQKYGGKYEVSGESVRPILWLHCSQTLRDAQVGVPFLPSEEGIWECSAEEVASAIGTGMAQPRDFMALSGGCIWEKTGGGSAGGLRGQVWDGKFEPVSLKQTQEIWDALKSQDLLSTTNIDKSIEISRAAWEIAGKDVDKKDSDSSEENDDDRIVFSSNVRVSDLADAVLRRWVATYVLKAPNLPGAELPGVE